MLLKLLIYPAFNGGGYSKSEVDTLLNDYIPKAGGAVLDGAEYFRTVDNDRLVISSATSASNGGSIDIYGKEHSLYAGFVSLKARDSNHYSQMIIQPSGTWIWNGTAVQIPSDQRYKQQITQIDNALLDAWEDVELVQFKYNDAVEQKGSKARFHTGYVVQQIDTSCKSHNVDISEYGLYCHEEYPEETEEVEVTQEDGTIKKETKVIREASEHYSLRYTETLVVECAYLRRENNRLKERLSKIEKLLNI